MTAFRCRSLKNTFITKCLPVVSRSETPSKIQHSLCFCFQLSTQSGICRWFNLFTSTCSHSCVCCSLVVIFELLSTLASHCLFCLVSAYLKNCTSVSLFGCCFFFWFSCLKLHKGTRTHAQLPRRPVPPPKPRRSKKGVSGCRVQLPTAILSAPLWFSGLLVFMSISM